MTWSAMVQPAAGVARLPLGRRRAPPASRPAPAVSATRSAVSARRSTAHQRPCPDRAALVAEGGRAFLGVRAEVHRRPDPLGLRRTPRRSGCCGRQVDRLAWRRAPTAARWPRCARPAPARPRAARPAGTTWLTSPISWARGRADRIAGEQDLHGDPRAAPARAAAPPTASRGPTLTSVTANRACSAATHQVAVLRQQEPAGVGDPVDRGDGGLVHVDVAAELRQEVRRRHGQRVVGHLLAGRRRRRRPGRRRR